MKKILLSIPLIFVIVLSCVPVMSASAIVFVEETHGYTEETFASYGGGCPSACDFSGSYFFFCCTLNDWSRICDMYAEHATMGWYYLDLDNSDVTMTEENGVIHFEWTKHNNQCPFYALLVTYSTYNERQYSDGISNEYTDFTNINDLNYEPSTGRCWSTGKNYKCGSGDITSSYKQQHLVINNQDYDSDALRVNVDTGGQLSGEFTIDNTDLFSVNVSNLGNTDIQWLFTISAADNSRSKSKVTFVPLSTIANNH